MFGRSTVLRSIALASCVAVSAGCSKSVAPPPPPRIALLSDTSGFENGSFAAAAAAGLAACAAETGAQVTQATPSSAADIEAQQTLLATENFDAVISIGATLAPDLATVARKFESTHFAVIDGVVASPNVESLTFKDQDGSFLAGALAALVTRTKRVAFLGGADIVRLHAAEAGFTAGVREVDPSVRVDDAFAGSFADETAAKMRAKALYDAGSDVIYVVAGRAGLGALAQANVEKKGYAIGVDSDQDALAPGHVLTSVLRRVDHAAARVCFESASQKPASGHVELGLAEGAVSLTDFKYSKAVVGAANIARVGRIADAVAAGTIVPPSSPLELARFKPVPIR